ncbi:MAG TPA: polysaccharide deacetylase family protein [Candidatus Tectomicrobia bacterium]|nr:polysaccharide deacetylase family protein [Candidatus Tectomicrobia bacterium]
MEAVGVLSHLLLGGLAAGVALYTIGADLLAVGGKGTVRRGPEHRHAVALTFDDGPDPVFTPRILDVLAQFGARATFFVIGKQAEQHPGIIRAIANAGHEVGNHTYGHRPLWLLLPHQTRQEIDRGAQVLSTILGEPPRYFRPPWGRFNLAATRHSTLVRQQRVLWSLRAEGWLPLASPETIVRVVARRLHPGAIIDLHDGGGLRGTPARTMAALPALLRLLQERHYRCLSLSELLTATSTTRAHELQPSLIWDWYESAWNAWYGVEKLGQDTILALGPAIHHGPHLILRDGSVISPGAPVGELHLDRTRVAHLHRTVACRRLGFELRRELERALEQLARMVVERPRYHRLQAFRSTTLFWKVATGLGFEVSTCDSGWHLEFLGWYQRRLLARDHPLGRSRLQGKRWEARTIWLSRQALLRHYGGGRR